MFFFFVCSRSRGFSPFCLSFFLRFVSFFFPLHSRPSAAVARRSWHRVRMGFTYARVGIIAYTPSSRLREPDAPIMSLARRRLRSLSRSWEHDRTGPGTSEMSTLKREQTAAQTRKEGIGVKSRENKKRNKDAVINVVRRLLSLPDKVQHCGFSLCSGQIPLPASGFARLNFRPRHLAAPFSIGLVAAKLDMLVMKAHTTYYGFPCPSEISISKTLSFSIFCFFFSPPLICCGSFIGDALSRTSTHPPDCRLPSHDDGQVRNSHTHARVSNTVSTRQFLEYRRMKVDKLVACEKNLTIS